MNSSNLPSIETTENTNAFGYLAGFRPCAIFEHRPQTATKYQGFRELRLVPVPLPAIENSSRTRASAAGETDHGRTVDGPRRTRAKRRKPLTSRQTPDIPFRLGNCDPVPEKTDCRRLPRIVVPQRSTQWEIAITRGSIVVSQRSESFRAESRIPILSIGLSTNAVVSGA